MRSDIKCSKCGDHIDRSDAHNKYFTVIAADNNKKVPNKKYMFCDNCSFELKMFMLDHANNYVNDSLREDY